MLTLAAFEEELARLVQRAHDAKLEPSEISDALFREMDELDVTAGEAVRSEPVEQVASPAREDLGDRRSEPAAPRDLGRIFDTDHLRTRADNQIHQSRHGAMPEPDEADLEAFAAALDEDTSRPWPHGPAWDRLRAAGLYETGKDGETVAQVVPSAKGEAAVSHLRQRA